MHKSIDKLQGIISITSKGTGYVAIGGEKNKGEDPEIDSRHLNTAMHGDLVEISLQQKKNGGIKERATPRQNAEVIKIIMRVKMKFTGVLEKEKDEYFLNADDPKMYTDIFIPKEYLNDAKSGQKVFVEMVEWKDPKKAPIGRVLKILGTPGENNTEMLAIAMEKGFDSSFPKKVEDEAKEISAKGGPASGWKEEYAIRRDMRQTLTFTIDPSDAKDFDDAISFKEIKDGKNTDYEVGIHIADVSYYVNVDSELDKEARERGTSVYLVDRTIPMLPEILSNDLCSLVPNKDRLTMSAIFIIDKNAKVKKAWFGRTVIHSQKRFTYEEAEESIEKPKAPLHKELSILNDLAKKLAKERFEKGAISLDQEEVKFVLDMYGVPINIVKKERGNSNKLIEEFMLLANRKVARLIGSDIKEIKNKNISIYRVHDLPSKEKMADLAAFLHSLGYKVPFANGIIPTHEINKLLKSLEGKPEADTVHRAVVKSMAKAIYSTKNIGHYGLAFPYYTHFTSPIRRYPDIIIHRLLQDFLSHKKINQEYLYLYEEMAQTASIQEKRASDAERSSIKYKQVEYMGKHIGEEFDGIISGVMDWGIYVEEINTKCEGLVQIKYLSDDFYIFDEKLHELVGKKKGKKFRLGDKIRIKVHGVDIVKKNINYVLA